MTPSLRGARAVVLGLGHFGGGLGAARWLARQGAQVVVTDRADAAALAGPAAALQEEDVELVLGGHAGVDFEGADLLVVNPAVPLDAPEVERARAAGVVITSEIALLLERWPGPVIGITGSNGKSTTAAMTHALLEAAGARSSLGGNVGGSLLERLDEAAEDEIAVLELSSFMLEGLAPLGLGPRVAVITNITPNHLDRHGTYQAYRAAKASILAQARYAVLCADDPEVALLAEGYHGQVFHFGSRGEVSVSPQGDLLDRFGSVLVADADIPVPGRMNRIDLAAATLAASAALADELRVARALPAALQAWRPLPHRLTLLGAWGGVSWVDDSVSTTPESTAASVEALDAPCVLIVGGRDKGLDPEGLIDRSRGRVRIVLTLGETAEALCRAFTQGGLQAESLGTVAAATERASRLARPGEVVLFSPGYSSHDQFCNYEERGRAFVRAVERLAATSADTEDDAVAPGHEAATGPTD